MSLKTVEELYEQARSAGLSHSTATQASELSRDTLVSSRLSGLWPTMPGFGAVANRGYAGPAPTIDSIYWLKKVGRSLAWPEVVRQLAKTDLPLVSNCRTRVEDWWKDGKIALDLEHLVAGGTPGQRHYTTVRVDIAACIAHDTKWVLAKILEHLTQRNVAVVENTILSETDLRHVSA